VWRAESKAGVRIGGKGMDGGRRIVVDQVDRMRGIRSDGGGVDIFNFVN
jgi:hypothetical protein